MFTSDKEMHFENMDGYTYVTILISQALALNITTDIVFIIFILLIYEFKCAGEMNRKKDVAL